MDVTKPLKIKRFGAKCVTKHYKFIRLREREGRMTGGLKGREGERQDPRTGGPKGREGGPEKPKEKRERERDGHGWGRLCGRVRLCSLGGLKGLPFQKTKNHQKVMVCQ